MSARRCGVKRCRKVARQAFDVSGAWRYWRNVARAVVHYEVCDEHAAEYFRGGGFIDVKRSERIKADIRSAASSVGAAE